MENDDVKEIEVDAEATQIDPNLGFDKNKAQEKSREERVEIEEPKPRFNMSLNTISILLSVAAIVLNLFGQLFTLISSVTYLVFSWLGTFCLFGTLGLFVYDVIKNKKIEFSPAFILMLIATVVACFVA